MTYFFSEDESYYTKKGIEAIIAKHDTVEEIIVFPKQEDLMELIKKDITKIAFMAPYFPSKKFPEFAETQFFEVILLPNKHGLLTTGQHNQNKKISEVLEEKLGVKIEESSIDMSSYGGAKELHDQVEIVKQKFNHGIPTKGFLLTGIPGTGKSFFAKCLAGELGYMLVSVNLSVFMEREDTVYAINSFFQFFEKTPGNYILWIDEIEKMFTGEKAQQVMGALLTNINEANNLSSVSSFFIVATANNIASIAKTNPEFFRNGRFDSIIFLLNPTEENALSIFDMYIGKQRKALRQKVAPRSIYNYAKTRPAETKTRSGQIGKMFMERVSGHGIDYADIENMTFHDFRESLFKNKKAVDIMEEIASGFEYTFDKKSFIRISMEEHRQDSSQKTRYVYTPAEIEFVILDSFSRYYLLSESSHDYHYLAKRYKPLQVNIKDGIRDILAKAGSFLEI